MEKRNLTCIGCPMGCQMTVEMDEGQVISVTGNTCKRGDDYARKEVTSPTRIVTSSVRVNGGSIAMVSVKTATDIPKGKIMDIMACIENVQVNAPVKIGDVIVKNAADTGVDVIATKSIAAS
jgi:CxxC motif-containing protein